MSEEFKANIPVFNKNEETELENELLFHLDEFTNEIMRTMTKDKDIIILKKVIEQQQKEIEEKRIIIFAGAEKVKQLEKGNLSLMESRIKWKNRYYKEKAKNKEFISKDKIREKIKKCNDYLKEEPMNIEKIEINAKISILQELLEE